MITRLMVMVLMMVYQKKSLFFGELLERVIMESDKLARCDGR